MILISNLNRGKNNKIMNTTLLPKNNREVLQSTSMSAQHTGYNPAVLDLAQLEEIKTPLQWLVLPLGGSNWLPSRLTDPLYGRDILNTQLKEMAAGAPGIEQVWKITESWPSLTKLLLEDRNNE